MKRVIIESPFKASKEHTEEENIKYARLCVKDSLSRGESPIASHLLYTQEGILNDSISSERELGIKAGLNWVDVSDYSVFYCDLGISDGMKAAMQLCEKKGHEYHVRYLDNYGLLRKCLICGSEPSVNMIVNRDKFGLHSEELCCGCHESISVHGGCFESLNKQLIKKRKSKSKK